MIIKCTSCGASQQLSSEKICTYCSSPIEEKKAEQNYKTYVSGEIGNLMSMAETAIDASNMEEALQYFNRVLEKDITNSDAWLGKGIAVVKTSKIGDIKTNEAIAYWKNAIKHAENPDSMGKRVAKEINQIVISFYPAIENHYIGFATLDNSFQDLVQRFATLEKALDYATELDKKEITYPETGYNLSKRVIDLPKKHANESISDASVEKFLGQLTTNEYTAARKRQEANDKIDSLNLRIEEIEQFSRVIRLIQEKYVEIIRKINPNHPIVTEFNQFLIDDKVRIEKVNQRKINIPKYTLGWGIGGFLLMLIFTGFDSDFVGFALFMGLAFALLGWGVQSVTLRL